MPLAADVVIVEHTTFSVSDNPELRLGVFLATASNSIQDETDCPAFRKGASSKSVGARR